MRFFSPKTKIEVVLADHKGKTTKYTTFERMPGVKKHKYFVQMDTLRRIEVTVEL